MNTLRCSLLVFVLLFVAVHSALAGDYDLPADGKLVVGESYHLGDVKNPMQQVVFLGPAGDFGSRDASGDVR
jgi:hypothetical protein